MLRVEGFETATVEELDAAIVAWQEGLKKTEPNKVLQVVDVAIHVREGDPRMPIFCTVTHALVPRHPQSQTLLVPANGAA